MVPAKIAPTACTLGAAADILGESGAGGWTCHGASARGLCVAAALERNAVAYLALEHATVCSILGPSRDTERTSAALGRAGSVCPGKAVTLVKYPRRCVLARRPGGREKPFPSRPQQPQQHLQMQVRQQHNSKRMRNNRPIKNKMFRMHTLAKMHPISRSPPQLPQPPDGYGELPVCVRFPGVVEGLTEHCLDNYV